MKNYKSIKSILRKQIKAKTNVLWTWEKGNNENFTMIYNNYGNKLTIYTSKQLLEEIENTEQPEIIEENK